MLSNLRLLCFSSLRKLQPRGYGCNNSLDGSQKRHLSYHCQNIAITITIQVKLSSYEHTGGCFCLFSKRFLFDDSEVLNSVMASCILGNMYMKGTEKINTNLELCCRYLTRDDVPRKKSIYILKCCSKSKDFKWAPCWKGVSQKTLSATEATVVWLS